jgi:hypothetical protein
MTPLPVTRKFERKSAPSDFRNPQRITGHGINMWMARMGCAVNQLTPSRLCIDTSGRVSLFAQQHNNHEMAHHLHRSTRIHCPPRHTRGGVEAGESQLPLFVWGFQMACRNILIPTRRNIHGTSGFENKLMVVVSLIQRVLDLSHLGMNVRKVCALKVMLAYCHIRLGNTCYNRWYKDNT